MASKTVFVSISGRNEQIEFRSDDKVDDVIEVFRAAAEASPNDLLKLYNTNNKVMIISADLKPNAPATRYRLDVVAVPCTSDTVAQALGIDIGRLDRKLESLEKKMNCGTEETDTVSRMRQETDGMIEKLTNTARLSWLGLSKTSDHLELDYVAALQVGSNTPLQALPPIQPPQPPPPKPTGQEPTKASRRPGLKYVLPRSLWVFKTR